VTAGIGTTGLATGRAVRCETVALEAGVLELETRRGARLVIEAPAAFRFESPQRLHLTKGRIAADVPARAKGFTVVTPSGEAIDLGTRFAVDVPAFGRSPRVRWRGRRPPGGSRVDEPARRRGVFARRERSP
jgi:hypothetical protein